MYFCTRDNKGIWICIVIKLYELNIRKTDFIFTQFLLHRDREWVHVFTFDMIVYVLAGGRMTLFQDDVSLWQLSGPLIRDTYDGNIPHGRVAQNESFQLGRGNLVIKK